MGRPLRSASSQSLQLNLSFETVRTLRHLASVEQTRVSILAEKLFVEALARRGERQRIAVSLLSADMAR